MTRAPGWHFLQIPGPTNVPERVLRALARPTTDHRGADFPALTRTVLDGLGRVLGTEGPVVVYPSSGTGGWEAALVNTLSPGDRVLMFETGQFALGWAEVGRRYGLDVELLPTDWRRGADPELLEERLSADDAHAYRAVAVVHNETSTGVLTRLSEVRQAMDRAQHPALLLVDTVSSLGCAEYQHDGWGVDVTMSASQKGLMLPPGLAFLALGPKALQAAERAQLPRSYWDWRPTLAANAKGFFPYTPATNLLYGLDEALAMLEEEGLETVYRRHARHGRVTRAAVTAWGLDTQCAREDEHSPVLTGVVMPEGHDADHVRKVIDERYNMSLGTGLGRLKGKIFRIGHLGDFNDLMLLATLAGVEAGLALAGVPVKRGGVDAALLCLEERGV